MKTKSFGINHSGEIRMETSDQEVSKATSIRAGIVGAGLMGRWHAKTVKKAGGQLSAVMDLDTDAAQRLAASHRGAQSFSNIEQMLNRVDLDVLHVCTPPPAHHDIAELAIDAGLNLIIEKPAMPTVKETERLFEWAANRSVLVCPVHQFIFQDGVLKAKELLPRIGRLVHMEGTFCSAGGTGLTSEQLDVIAADILPHPLSLMRLFGATELSEKKWVSVRPCHGELRAVCEASGITFSIFISMTARPTVCSFQIMGTDATLHIDLFHGYAFMEPGTVSRARKIAHPFESALRSLSAATINLGRRTARGETAYPGLQRLVVSFYHALQTKSPPPITPDDTIAIARVRDSIIHSTEFVKREREYVRS